MLRPNEIRDMNGGFLPAAVLGNIDVDIAPAGSLDIAALLADGQASVDATAWDIGGPAAIFDGNTSSLYRTPSINPAVVTLSFVVPQTLNGFRAYFSGGDYHWTVEAADSLADLDAQSGSYQLLASLNTPSDMFTSATLGVAATASHVRLTATRLTGDDYIHINAWELLSTAVTDTAFPTAQLLTAPTATAGEHSSGFTVRYSDDRLVDIRSVNFGDIRITVPNGFSQTAAFYGLNVNANGAMRDATYFVSPPGGTWDHVDNGTYQIVLLSQEVFDTAGKPISPLALGDFVVDVPPPEPRPRADLTELNADDWFAWADGATASASDDTVRTTFGAGSVRFDTTGGFDTYLRYEPPNGTMWDLSDANEFHFDVYAENPSPIGFQQEPIIRFIDLDGDVMEFRYWRDGSLYALWNDARDNWLSETIAVKSLDQPDTGWRGTAIGTPDWTRMKTVEIHADTWDAGFTLWFDRAGFDLPELPGDYNGDHLVDAADYIVWRKTLNSAVTPFIGADGDGDGVVDQDDLGIWKAHFGQSSTLSGSGAGAAAFSQVMIPTVAPQQPISMPAVLADSTGVPRQASENTAAASREESPIIAILNSPQRATVTSAGYYRPPPAITDVLHEPALTAWLESLNDRTTQILHRRPDATAPIAGGDDVRYLRLMELLLDAPVLRESLRVSESYSDLPVKDDERRTFADGFFSRLGDDQSAAAGQRHALVEEIGIRRIG
jgi:hypothetical protein